MRHLALISLLALAACGTPQSRCINNAGKDIHVLNKLIATTQGNITRGYGIRTETYVEDETQVCGQGPDGSDLYCDVAVAQERDVPVALDLKAEQAKLDSLLAKRAQLRQRAEAVIQECKVRYPEG